MPNLARLLISALLLLTLTGCASRAGSAGAPSGSSAESTVGGVVAAPVAPVAAPAPTAADYLAKADRSGTRKVPPAGSALRKTLLGAARDFLESSSPFVARRLARTGEVITGVIQPEGSVRTYNVTWVLWKGKWAVATAEQSDGAPSPPPSAGSPEPGSASFQAESAAGDDTLGRAFASHATNLEVEGRGTVSKVLSDDNDGARHQRFILKLASGQTLLVAHNIVIAPRVPLSVGAAVAFRGEYEWNAQGGVIHWTHHDPDGSHSAGWIKLGGRTYQ